MPTSNKCHTPRWMGTAWREEETMLTPMTTCFFFQHEPRYSLGAVLTLPMEEGVSALQAGSWSPSTRLGIGVWTRAMPRPGAGVTLPTQYYIPDPLDRGALEAWGLNFDQTS